MASFDREYFNLGYLDQLAYRTSPVHRLDPRAKLIVTFAFTLAVVSFPKYEIQALAPFFLFPVLIAAFGDLPAGFILKKIIVVSPFALLIGIFNPLLDTEPLTAICQVNISGGWISFFSIMVKFILTVSSALLLIATTSFPGVCIALRKLGVPEILVAQLLFLYRFLFVLAEEAMRIVRAREMRSFSGKGGDVRVFVNLVGMLFIRTMERSERIYQAMLSRGYDGNIRIARTYEWRAGDWLFIISSLSTFYVLRTFDITGKVGRYFFA